MIGFLGVFFAIHVLVTSKSKVGANNFAAFGLFTGIGFLGGGIAHYMLDIYFKNGETMDHEWGKPNAGWMYPWLLTSLSAMGAAAVSCLTFAQTSAADAAPWVY